MRAFPCLLLGLSGLLGGCESATGSTRRAPVPKASVEQREIYERVILLFQVGTDEFGKALREGRDDPVLASKLTQFLVVHMREAERLQRRAQRGDFELRSLEENARYSEARKGLGVLGDAALPTLRQRLIEHRLTENRLFGITTLAALGPDAVPAIRDAMLTSKPRYHRYYVEAVSRMPPAPKVERQLLEWTRSDSFSVRAEALRGLVAYGDRHLVLLRSVVREDSDAFVQRQVVERLGGYRDPATIACVLGYYQRCAASGEDRGIRAAERTLLRMSGKKPRRRGDRLVHHGLAYWQRWAREQPAVREKR